MLLFPLVVSLPVNELFFTNARLVTEGVHSIAPRRGRATEMEVRGHALGCLTLADLLSLVEMKYAVVTGFLYTEMLRQHYGTATLRLGSTVSLHQSL